MLTVSVHEILSMIACAVYLVRYIVILSLVTLPIQQHMFSTMLLGDGTELDMSKTIIAVECLVVLIYNSGHVSRTSYG